MTQQAPKAFVVALCLTGCASGSHDGADDLVAKAFQPVTGKLFGTHCQDEYENNWAVTLPSTFTLCSRFNSQLSSTDTQQFYFNLHGKQTYWETSNDQATNSLESVDLFFASTHGGKTHTIPGGSPVQRANWAMWDDNGMGGVRARGDFMRLGDESHGLSIFVNYACDAEAWDSYTWTRWSPIFKGGLRAAIGSHDTITWCGPWTCPTQLDHGKRFAQYLQQGLTFLNAWGGAFDDNDGHAQDITVMFSGTNGTNCSSRRDGMTWANFSTYPRLQDSSAAILCGWQWTDLD